MRTAAGIIVLGLITACCAEARVGETEAALRERYGAPVAQTTEAPGKRIWFFKDPILVCTEVAEGQCWGIAYIRVQETSAKELREGRLPSVIGWDWVASREAKAIRESHTPGLWTHDGRCMANPKLVSWEGNVLTGGPPSGSRWAPDHGPRGLMIVDAYLRVKYQAKKRSADRERDSKPLTGF